MNRRLERAWERLIFFFARNSEVAKYAHKRDLPGELLRIETVKTILLSVAWREKGTREAKSESGCRGRKAGNNDGFLFPISRYIVEYARGGSILIQAPIVVVHVQKSCCTIARKGGL